MWGRKSNITANENDIRVREKNIKKPKRVADWGKKTLGELVLVTPDGVAVLTGGLFILIRPVLGVVVVLFAIPRRHVRGIRVERHDGPGW